MTSWRQALVVLPGVLVLSGITLAQNIDQWRTDSGWGWSLWTSQAQIVGPVLGAVACWAVVDALRGDRGIWLSTGSRSRAILLAAIRPAALVAVVTLAASFVVVLVLSEGETGPGRWIVAGVLNAAAVTLACLAIGAITGRLWVHPVAPGAVAVGLWGAAIGAESIPRVGEWLAVDGASTPLAGYLPALDLATHRLVAAIVVVLLAIALLNARPIATWSSRGRVEAGVAAAAVLAVVVGSGWFGAADDVRSDPAARSTACASSGGGDAAEITACVLRERSSQATAAATGLAALDRGLRDLGIDAPARYEQITPYAFYARQSGEEELARPERDATFTLPQGGDVGLEVALSTMSPPECLALAMERSQERRWFEASDVVAYWVGLTVTGEEVFRSPPVDAYRALDPEAQRRWMASAVEALRSCEPAALPTL